MTDCQTLRTLIVDDSEDECILLRAELRHVPSIDLIGFVHDGVEALAYIQGVNNFKDRESFPYPDLILLDYQMPRRDGMQVLQQLRHQLHRPHVILWSNTLDRLNVPQAMRLGADLVCEKPCNKSGLLEILNHFRMKIFNHISVPPCRTAAEPAHVGD